MSSLEYITNPQTDFLQNPINILQQEKSSITTNPFVQPKTNIQNDTPKNIKVKPPTFFDINQKLSTSIMGLIDDIFEKPDDIPWIKYLQIILEKDERYTYLTVLFIFTSLFIILLN